MTSPFIFQRAGGASGFLEAAVESAATAASGGGVFAFASAAGVEAFFGDVVIANIAAEGTFDLVVGLDAITDTKAVETLLAAEGSLDGLSVTAFLNPRKGVLFHPKFCWFETEGGLILLAGSSNLTIGGLRGNWEAASRHVLEGAPASEVLESIAAWRDEMADHLLPLADNRVLEQAARNGRQNAVVRRYVRRGADAVAEVAAEATEMDAPSDLAMLVAEIPRAGTRWAQANFDRASYEGFFGARVGSRRRIILRHVEHDGTLGEVEVRPSVAVASHNWRFELAAASGLPYPSEGPPIGVFLRAERGYFLYSLVLPGAEGYEHADGFLGEHWAGPEGRMRRVRTTVGEVRAYWENAPILAAARADVADI